MSATLCSRMQQRFLILFLFLICTNIDVSAAPQQLPAISNDFVLDDMTNWAPKITIENRTGIKHQLYVQKKIAPPVPVVTIVGGILRFLAGYAAGKVLDEIFFDQIPYYKKQLVERERYLVSLNENALIKANSDAIQVIKEEQRLIRTTLDALNAIVEVDRAHTQREFNKVNEKLENLRRDLVDRLSRYEKTLQVLQEDVTSTKSDLKALSDEVDQNYNMLSRDIASNTSRLKVLALLIDQNYNALSEDVTSTKSDLKALSDEVDQNYNALMKALENLQKQLEDLKNHFGLDQRRLFLAFGSRGEGFRQSELKKTVRLKGSPDFGASIEAGYETDIAHFLISYIQRAQVELADDLGSSLGERGFLQVGGVVGLPFSQNDPQASLRIGAEYHEHEVGLLSPDIGPSHFKRYLVGAGVGVSGWNSIRSQGAGFTVDFLAWGKTEADLISDEGTILPTDMKSSLQRFKIWGAISSNAHAWWMLVGNVFYERINDEVEREYDPNKGVTYDPYNYLTQSVGVSLGIRLYVR